MVLTIEQAVGYCDGNTAKTEMFKISQIDPTGKVVFQDFEITSKAELRQFQDELNNERK